MKKLRKKKQLKRKGNTSNESSNDLNAISNDGDSIRLMEVENAVLFLCDPKVENMAPEDKISFLRNRGMTPKEIQRAEYEVQVRKQEIAELSDDFEYESDREESNLFYKVGVSGLLTAAAFAGISSAFPSSVARLRQTFQHLKPKVENQVLETDKEESMPKENGLEYNEKTMYGFNLNDYAEKSTLEDVIERGNELQRKMNLKLDKLTDAVGNLADSFSGEGVQKEILSELKSLKTVLIAGNLGESADKGDYISVLTKVKAVEKKLKEEQEKEVEEERIKNMDPMERLLLKSKTEENKSSDSEIQEKSEARKENDFADEIKSKKEKFSTELQKMMFSLLENNTTEEAEKALQTLCLYIGNLLSNIDNKVYGKISVANSTYKKTLQDIPNHKEVLEACGFFSSGYSKKILEFNQNWRENKDNWSLEVLKFAKGELESTKKKLKEAGSTPLPHQEQAQKEDEPNTSSPKEQPQDTNEALDLSFSDISAKLAEDPNWKPANVQEVPDKLSKDREALLEDSKGATPSISVNPTSQDLSFKEFLEQNKISDGASVEEVN
eukprot:snap_masked-scaffold_33-processed-gene-0.18-mRNA-1 protein AED:1.00 eAED:1.00 QI:0/-1/0/0/-1/1/1/0/553